MKAALLPNSPRTKTRHAFVAVYLELNYLFHFVSQNQCASGPISGIISDKSIRDGSYFIWATPSNIKMDSELQVVLDI
jgi:hypothetical protein